MFPFPKAKLRPKGQLLPLKLLGSPALSDRRAASVTACMEQHRGEDETTLS
jgi:hypothetical protein